MYINIFNDYYKYYCLWSQKNLKSTYELSHPTSETKKILTEIEFLLPHITNQNLLSYKNLGVKNISKIFQIVTTNDVKYS